LTLPTEYDSVCVESEGIMDVISKMLDTTPRTSGNIITEPTLLSECGTKVTIDEKDKYNIDIEAGEYLVISMGFTSNKPGAKFNHPNIALTKKTIHEFKHYRQGGSKFWTSRAGIDHYLIIPRNQIKIIPEKGYSYIKAEINGVKVSFNVSGGGGGGWTDYLRTLTQTSVNHKLADIKKIAEVAVRNSPYEPLIPKEFEPIDEERWNKLAAKANPKIKEQVCKMIDEGKKPVIYFVSGYSYGGEHSGVAVKVERRYKKVPCAPSIHPILPSTYSYKLEETGAPRRIVLEISWYKVSAKLTQIDWYKTATENKLIA
jgi:hypothetical protein